ncbi:FAD-binding oxidoreductase, partial [Salmonella sp. SAL04281]|uniref:FAD-binding oxidoreductase n=1 Tax=Salmonella sp. SAL04281 TaxID=3159859 RepID=UPI00397C6DA0
LVRCVKVIQETWDVRTLCFMADQPILFFFKPGQFVTLELEIDGEPVMRSYTISSSPSVPYSFSITIKRVPGGRVSNWLHDNLKEG